MTQPAGGGAPSTVLRKGDHGDAVKTLQTNLQALGYSPGVLDGVYGELTEEAVMALQRAAGITADGIAGPVTMAAMAQWLAVPPDAGIYRVQVGAFTIRANAVRLLAELKARGYDGYIV